MEKMDERKQKLITALEKEKERLDKLGVDTHAHFITIDYLKTGSYGCDPTEVEEYIDDYVLLDLDFSWLVDEILMFLNKELSTSYILRQFGDKYDYTTLDEIVKNNFKQEYEYVLQNFEVGG